MGNFIELEQKYGLIYNFKNESEALEKAISLLEQKDLKQQWAQKRENLLKDKIDVTGFVVWLIENYPSSFSKMKEHPGLPYRLESDSGDISRPLV
jgi:hypothetical protein